MIDILARFALVTAVSTVFYCTGYKKGFEIGFETGYKKLYPMESDFWTKR